MVEILMLDLGETLVHGNAALPHVPEALQAISGFRTASDRPLGVCLVSDFTMPQPRTPPNIEAAFRQFVLLLEGLGLRARFEPVRKRVTLSTHVGVRKPDRRVFETAIQRLGRAATLAECLFVTENADHVRACRDLGMKTLLFDAGGGPGADFSDWSEGPLLIARVVDPGGDHNLQPALRMRLEAGKTVTAP